MSSSLKIKDDKANQGSMIYITWYSSFFSQQFKTDTRRRSLTISLTSMGKTTNEKEPKICKRCKKNTSTDLICTSCKAELLNIYDSKIDWYTAFEIERIQKSVLRYMDDDS